MRQLSLWLLLWLPLIAFANPENSDLPGRISGTVFDAALNQPLPYVSVAILDANGEIITGGVTDENGNFDIKEIADGTVTVSIQYIGFKTYTREVEIKGGNRNVKLGQIMLEEDAEALDEVTVTAERTTIEQKLDRKVINVGKDLTTAGPTASDIMNNLPSVSVDQQTGVLALRGNTNVRVMVDGKLTNVPVAQLLRQIPSTSIKQIELITNPSAKYQPEGMSGIINIILHKNTNVGFNGSVNTALTYEKQPKFNAGVDMNYRNGPVNLFGNWAYNDSKNVNYGNIFRPDDNSEQFFDILDDSRSNLVKLGVDVYLNDKNTVSVFTNQNFFDGGTEGITPIVEYDNPLAGEVQIFTALRENHSAQYNFDYKLDFEKQGHNIELEVDYNDFSAEEDTTFDFEGNAPSSEDYVDFIETERDRLTINLDYVNPLSETTKLEAGGEIRLFNSDISRTTDQQVLNPFDIEGNLINGPMTDFDYNRDIYAIYATFGKNWEKWSVQAGLRAEYVDVVANTVEAYGQGVVTDDLTNVDTDPNVTVTRDGDEVLKNFVNDYYQVYPSAFVTYTPSEKNQFQISYSRRVDRPGLEQINPIREWSTPRISSFGKTSLLPQFTNSMEVNYTRSLEKGSITGGVFFRLIEDEINRALFVDRTDLNKVILTYDNFENTNAYGIEISSNYRPTKWWNFNASFDMYSQTQKGVSERLADVPNPTEDDIIQESFEVDNTAWNLRMINNFKATKDLTFTVFGMYRGRARTLQFTVEPMAMVNIGARYTLLDGQMTFALNYNDIFDTMYFAFDGELPYRQVGSFNWESQTWNASLNYRFGGGKYRAKSRKRRDNDEKSGSGIF
jgi:outer membrane receptor protein involved in Fe transport